MKPPPPKPRPVCFVRPISTPPTNVPRPPGAPVAPPRPQTVCYVGAVATPIAPVNPLGGPASGLFSNANGRGSAAAQAGPSPGPACSDTPADIFADCFGSCTGAVDLASPGPVCGWTWDPATSIGGSVSFTPGAMSLNTPTQSEQPTVSKPVSMPGIFNLTGQFTFTEFPGTSGVGNVAYNLTLNDFSNLDWLLVSLDDSGGVTFIVGPQPNGWSNYLGTWTPTGGTHQVHFTVDALGVPRLWVDGVEIVLVFFALGAGGPAQPPNTAEFNVFNLDGPGPSKSAVVREVFVASGVLPPETIFCCP